MLKKLGLLAALSVGLTGTAQEAMDMTKCPVHEGGMSMEEAHASGMKNPHALKPSPPHCYRTSWIYPFYVKILR